MSDDKDLGLFQLTMPVLMTMPNISAPRAFGKKGKETGEPKYSANFLFAPDHVDLAQLKAKALLVAKARWPGRDFAGQARLVPRMFAFPFVGGDTIIERKKAKGEQIGDAMQAGAGLVVLAARSKFPPSLGGVVNGRAVDFEDEASRTKACKDLFFNGAEVYAMFNFVGYEGVGANPDGVTAYLQSLFATGKGTRFKSAAASASQTFSKYVGSMSAVDPTGGVLAEEEIPY